MLHLEKTLSRETGVPFRLASSDSLAGGCIHDARRLEGADGRTFFAKMNDRDHLPGFEAEAFALGRIAATGTLRVPRPVATCKDGTTAALILEYLPLQRGGRPDWSRLGRELAQLHRSTGEAFGWPHDNWIGSSPQKNNRYPEWPEFYAECRLRPQMAWAREKGLCLSRGGQLIAALPRFFEDLHPLPSLLHGDLWSGNAAFLDDGTPVVFDPASYYGDRETDLAMTEMFGGFPPAFYSAYREEWPLEEGYPRRRDLYLLYHVLNHYVLFGGGYGSQAEAIVDRLLRSA